MKKTSKRNSYLLCVFLVWALMKGHWLVLAVTTWACDVALSRWRRLRADGRVKSGTTCDCFTDKTIWGLLFYLCDIAVLCRSHLPWNTVLFWVFFYISHSSALWWRCMHCQACQHPLWLGSDEMSFFKMMNRKIKNKTLSVLYKNHHHSLFSVATTDLHICDIVTVFLFYHTSHLCVFTFWTICL